MEHEEDKDMLGSVNPSEIATLSLLNGGIGGIGRGVCYDGGSFMGDAILSHHTNENIRREGDQSENRDRFSNVVNHMEEKETRQELRRGFEHLAHKIDCTDRNVWESRLEAKCLNADTQKLIFEQTTKGTDLQRDMEIDRLRHNCSNLNHGYTLAQNALQAAATSRSVFVDGNVTSSNNSGQISAA